MEMKDMRKIEDGLCDALHTLAEQGIRSSSDVETTKHALSGLVKLKCLEEMEDVGNERSGRSYRSYEGMDGGSYRRDSRGRYMDGGYRDGYSGHSDLRQKLEDMMRNADDRDKDMIRQMVNRM